MDQEKECKEPSNQSPVETRLYKIRWWIGAFYGSQIILLRFIMNSFGVVSNAYKIYFNISYFAVDWFMLIQIPGIFVGTIILSYLTFIGAIRFRNLFIVMITCCFGAYALTMIATAYPVLFGLIYVGQFACGFALQSSIAIYGTFATAWFPENQVGFAISIKPMGVVTGSLLAFLIPSQLIPAPPQFRREYNVSVSTNDTTLNDIKSWQIEVYWKFMFLYSGLLLGCAIIWVFAIIFVRDQPPLPPTLAQAIYRAKQNVTKASGIETRKNVMKFLIECKTLYLNAKFLGLTFMKSAILTSVYLEKALVSEITREVFFYRHYALTEINKMSGYLLVAFEASGFLGALISGKIVDNIERHTIMLRLSLFIGFLSICGLAIGSYYLNVVMLFIFNAFFGFFVWFMIVPLNEIILQETFPKNPSFVLLLIVGLSEIILLVFGEIFRAILDYVNGTAVIIAMSALMLLGFVVSLFINPVYRRQEANKMASSSSSNENVNLLSSK